MPKIASQLTKAQSNKVDSLRSRIEKLRAELDAIGSSVAKSPVKRGPKKAAAAKAAPAPKAKAAKSGKRVMSPEARAKIAEAQRRRWAKARKGK